MKNAFISYRRQDSPGYVRALYDRLVHHFGAKQVFMDVDDIQLGSDFVSVLDNNLKGCAVMLVVIGNDWLTATDASGKRRLENPADFVRLEVSRALERQIPVIPILVSDAQMPSEADLPEDLKPLARRQALELNNKNYDYGIRDLVKALEKYLGKAKNTSNENSSHEEIDGNNTNTVVPWYKRRSLLYLWLLIAPPVGIYGLWKSSDMPNALKVALALIPIVIMASDLEIWMGLVFIFLVPAALIYLWMDKNIHKKTKILYTVFSTMGAIVFAALMQQLFFPEDAKKTTETTSVTTEESTTMPSTDAGFDCTSAHTEAEKAICASNAAKQADRDLVNAYRALEAKVPPAERDAMWESQKKWLKERDKHITNRCLREPNEQQTSRCIAAFYKERTSRLNGYFRSKFTKMRIIDPPSNIRVEPNGSVICKAPKKDEKITVYAKPVKGKKGKLWYWTKYCDDKWGVIHNSQIKPL